MTHPPDVVTPALVVEADVLEANLAAMARRAVSAGLALRPHAKTHKCPELARRQLAAGAVGMTVATLGEAEGLVGAGVEDVFVAYPLWADAERAERLDRLRRRARILVGVDSAAGAAALGALAGGGGPPVEVLVEVDSGHHRSGVAPEEALGVARAAAGAGLEVAGVFSFPGHGYAPGAPAPAAADEAHALGRAARILRDAGFAAPVVSGGSTPTAPFTTDVPPAGDGTALTELRPGVYVFNDAQQVVLGTCTLADVALTVAATVVSAPAPDRVVLDAGSKALGADRPPWMESFGLVPGLPGARITGLSEHHAVVTVDPDHPAPPVGGRLAVVPVHVCSAVNLADELVVVRSGEVEDRWPLMPRGANR